MNANFNDINFVQINKRIEELRPMKEKAKVRTGWIKYMRKALGLSLHDLAKLANSSIATTAQSEKREVEDKVTLSTLKKYATAMDCEVVYCFIPKKDLKNLIKDKAYIKARNSLIQADLHMKLEDQKVEGDLEEQIERLALKLIEKGDIW